MSLAFTLISAVLLVAVFATGTFVGYLAVGRSTNTSRRAHPSSAQPPAQVLEELRALIERIERRIIELARAKAKDANQPLVDGRAEMERCQQTKPEFASVLPDVEHQLREIIAEIRHAQDALENSAASRGIVDSGRQVFVVDEQPVSAGRPGKAEPEDSAEDTAAAESNAGITERRSRMRHSFGCRQWVAPYNGSHIPGPDEFHNVQCNDISSVGISFFMDSDPNSKLVVIRLAGPRGAKFLTARVRRVTPSDETEGGVYVVGCQFLDTIHFEALPPRLNHSIVRRERQGCLETPISQAMSGA